MAARFRIDQTGPGTGTLDRSRTDLVDGAAINLVVPSPVVGATYSWEIIYKYRSTATLSAATGTSVSIGPGGSIPRFCAFLIQLTETIGPTSTRRKRIAAVRGGAKNFRPLVFGETANPNSSRTTRNADDSTDNEERVDIDGVTGENAQNWSGWVESLNEALYALESGTIDPFEVVLTEALSKMTGGNAYEMLGISSDPEAPGGNSGIIYTKIDGGETKLFYVGNNGVPVCISEVAAPGGVVGNDPSTLGAILLWDSEDGTLVKESAAQITTSESSVCTLGGLHIVDLAGVGAVPDAPASGGRLCTVSDGGDAVEDLCYVKADSTVVQITRGNNLAKLYPFEVVDQAGEAVLENGYGYGFLPSVAGLAAPVDGGRLYVLDDSSYLVDVLRYINAAGIVTRITAPNSVSLVGTAIEDTTFDSSGTVYEGMFARFDLSGGTCTATLDAAIPIGGTCVVKVLGAVGGNQLDIVDGAAQTIDGVATYTLNADNAFARLTKMGDGTWAVG